MLIDGGEYISKCQLWYCRVDFGINMLLTNHAVLSRSLITNHLVLVLVEIVLVLIASEQNGDHVT